MLHRDSGHSIAAAIVVALVLATQVSAQEAAPAPPVPQAQPLPPSTQPTPPAVEQQVPSLPEAASQPQVPAGQSLAPEPSVEPQPDTQDAVEPGDVMENILPEMAAVPSSTLPHDLSPMGMFLAADWVVKGVMISLAFASLVTWTIWIVKTLQLSGAKLRASKGIKAITHARTLQGALQALHGRGGVVAGMVRFADNEVRLSDPALDHAGGEGLKERVGSALSRIEVQAGRNISKGTGVLATIGSTAPFVGLFGTVWGIMNSFIGISESQTTNLAIVAPGIAEALLATAIGLVAAIPAVIIYNVFARSVTGYRQALADAAAGIERLVSRDLDFRKIPAEAGNPKIKLVTE